MTSAAMDSATDRADHRQHLCSAGECFSTGLTAPAVIERAPTTAGGRFSQAATFSCSYRRLTSKVARRPSLSPRTQGALSPMPWTSTRATQPDSTRRRGSVPRFIPPASAPSSLSGLVALKLNPHPRGIPDRLARDDLPGWSCHPRASDGKPMSRSRRHTEGTSQASRWPCSPLTITSRAFSTPETTSYILSRPANALREERSVANRSRGRGRARPTTPRRAEPPGTYCCACTRGKSRRTLSPRPLHSATPAAPIPSVAYRKGSTVIFIATRSGIGFPDGMAPTARVRAYTEGLRLAGRDVCVLCMSGSRPVGNASSPTLSSGEYRGTPYRYTAGTPTLAKNRLLRAIQRLRGVIGASSLILRRHWREKDVEAIVLYPDSLPSALALRLVAWTCHVPLLLEKSELPSIHRPQTRWSEYTLPVYVAVTYRIFDGIIVVSDYLEHYFASRVGRNTRLLQVPILVDPAFAEAIVDPALSSPCSGSRIVYAGGLTEAKDGVLTLIEAFREVANTCDATRLVIVGGCRSDTAFKRCCDAARSLGVADRIDFLEQLPRDEVVQCLRGAQVLVLPRPASEQALSGMPTKLAEYLVTGRPVVMTNIGQQAVILRDRVTAFMVPPNDAASLASTLVEVLRDPDAANTVGLRGRDLALREFSARHHGQRIAEFISSCGAKRRRVR